LLLKGDGSEIARPLVRNQNLTEETGVVIGACSRQKKKKKQKPQLESSIKEPTNYFVTQSTIKNKPNAPPAPSTAEEARSVREVQKRFQK